MIICNKYCNCALATNDVSSSHVLIAYGVVTTVISANCYDFRFTYNYVTIAISLHKIQFVILLLREKIDKTFAFYSFRADRAALV